MMLLLQTKNRQRDYPAINKQKIKMKEAEERECNI